LGPHARNMTVGDDWSHFDDIIRGLREDPNWRSIVDKMQLFREDWDAYWNGATKDVDHERYAQAIVDGMALLSFIRPDIMRLNLPSNKDLALDPPSVWLRDWQLFVMIGLLLRALRSDRKMPDIMFA